MIKKGLALLLCSTLSLLGVYKSDLYVEKISSYHTADAYSTDQDQITQLSTSRPFQNITIPPPTEPPDSLEALVALRNSCPRKSLDSLLPMAKKFGATNSYDVQELLQGYTKEYIPGSGRLKLTRYDHLVAPDSMKEAMVDMYQNSRLSVNKIAFELTQMYGISISPSSVSRIAKKRLHVSSRKQACKVGRFHDRQLYESVRTPQTMTQFDTVKAVGS